MVAVDREDRDRNVDVGVLVVDVVECPSCASAWNHLSRKLMEFVVPLKIFTHITEDF